MLGEQLLVAGSPKRRESVSLATVVERRFGVVLDKSYQEFDWSLPELPADALAYAARDVAYLAAIRDQQLTELNEHSLLHVANLEMQLLTLLVRMRLRGITLDANPWNALALEAELERELVDAQLTDMVGADVLHDLAQHVGKPSSRPKRWNWNSGEQVQELFRRRGHPIEGFTKGSLATVAELDPLADLLLRRKALNTRATTYGVRFVAKNVHPLTGLVHSEIGQVQAQTGRIAYRKPNLQNIPRDQRYRACVVPRPGYRFVKGDWPAIEARIMAVRSGDEALLDSFRRGRDIHLCTAMALRPDKARATALSLRARMGRPVLTITDAEAQEELLTLGDNLYALFPEWKGYRQLAKAVLFGLLYGAGARRLRAYAREKYGVDMSLADAERWRAAFFAIYPGLEAWQRRQARRTNRDAVVDAIVAEDTERAAAEGRTCGLHDMIRWGELRRSGDQTVDVRTLFGRRCRGLTFEDYTLRLNAPCQGTGADLLKLTLLRLDEEIGQFPDTHIAFTVHDEIVLECPADVADRVAVWLGAVMQAEAERLLGGLPTPVQAEVLRTWGEKYDPGADDQLPLTDEAEDDLDENGEDAPEVAP
jgi:DNA polymerase-1